MRRYKVLVLEGGGALGVLPIHFLSMLPTDKQNLEKVDVLSGCSIGGILAASLATGKQFGYIDSVFQERAKDCFVKRFNAKINPLSVPIYKNEALDIVLKEMIGDITVGEIKNIYPNLKVIIPALDVTEDKYLVFSNLVHEYDDVSLFDIAGMTSAAPSYFDCREFRGNAIVDGGLLDVTSAITAVTTLKKYLGVPFAAMDVLVLATGKDIDEKPLTIERYRSLNLLGIATDILRGYATLGNQLANNSFLEGLGFHYYHYFNPCTTNGELDNTKQIPDLVKQADKYREEFLEAYNYWLTL
jgi:patatin-like phospholipase/acyl hydrolase